LLLLASASLVLVHAAPTPVLLLSRVYFCLACPVLSNQPIAAQAAAIFCRGSPSKPTTACVTFPVVERKVYSLTKGKRGCGWNAARRGIFPRAQLGLCWFLSTAVSF
jgi:hypothetical protein